MARCSVWCENGKFEKLMDCIDEIESSESDGEVTSFVIDIKDEKCDDGKDDSTNTTIGDQHEDTGIVFSLECLHDEPDAVLETIDTDVKPEIIVKPCKEMFQNSESSKIDETPEIIDIDDVPELIPEPPEKNSQNSESLNIDETQEVIDIGDVTYLIPERPEEKLQILKPEVKENTELKQMDLVFLENLPQIDPSEILKKFPFLDSLCPTLLSRNLFEGKHNFMIGVSCPQFQKKAEPLIFCEVQNKIYVAKDHPFKVIVKAEGVPPGSLIKVTAAYSLPEHSSIPVQRCPSHAHQDFLKGFPAYEHVTVSLYDSAIYKKENNVLSVSVPYEEPQNGELYTIYLYKLTCFSSCLGGINRRPFSLIFVLEKDGITLGRQSVETKVCACPWRDYGAETQRLSKQAETQSHFKQTEMQRRLKSRNQNKLMRVKEFTPYIKIPLGIQESVQKYSITVKDPELFKFLKEMKTLYEVGTTAKDIIKEGT